MRPRVVLKFLSGLNWFRIFKNGRKSTESDARAGRPSASNNEAVVSKVRDLIRQDRQITVRQIAKEVRPSPSSTVVMISSDLDLQLYRRFLGLET